MFGKEDFNVCNCSAISGKRKEPTMLIRKMNKANITKIDTDLSLINLLKISTGLPNRYPIIMAAPKEITSSVNMLPILANKKSNNNDREKNIS